MLDLVCNFLVVPSLQLFRVVVISGASLVFSVNVEVDGISVVLFDVRVIDDFAMAAVVSRFLLAVVASVVALVCFFKIVGSVVGDSVVADVVVATELRKHSPIDLESTRNLNAKNDKYQFTISLLSYCDVKKCPTFQLNK